MKKHLDRHEAKLTPGEDARVWQAMQVARRAAEAEGGSGADGRGRRWLWPGLTTAAALAAVAVLWVGPQLRDRDASEPVAVNLSSENPTAENLNAENLSAENLSAEKSQALVVDRSLEGVEAPELKAPVRAEKDEGGDATTEHVLNEGSETMSTMDEEPLQELASSEPGSKAVGLVVPEERYPKGKETAPTSYHIDAAELDKLPVDTFEEAVNLQGGVVNKGEQLHFRGGRAGNPEYEIEGVPVPPAEKSAAPSTPLGKPGMGQLTDNDQTARRQSPYPNSVGGTDPVNDEPYDAMFFKNYGVNPFVAVEDDRFATFAVDVDNASYTMTRSYLLSGHLPPAEAVRVEEFINTLDHHYPAPSGKLMASSRPVPSKFGTFAIYLDAAPSPYDAKRVLMRVGLKGREIDAQDRKPANLTFVIDVSGSMGRENRLGLVKQSLHLLLDELKPTDRVALVVYGSTAHTMLPPTDAEDAGDIRSAIDALTTEGSTNAEAGLTEGYALAAQMFSSGANNRVILCSDGVANVGRTGAGSILERIHREAGRGIELTAVGFGMGNYNDVLMEQLADKGDGNYYYVDTLREAKRIFREGLTGTLETIAKDTKIQVEFTPEVVNRYRLLGYENRDVADKDFRNDAVDAGEVGAGHEVTALFEMRLEDGARGKDTAAIVRIRYKNPATGEVIEEARELRVSMIQDRFENTDPGFRLDAAAAQFAEVLRGSYWAKDVALPQVAGMAREASRELGRPEQAEELTGLIERAAGLTDVQVPYPKR